jgi:hypothetical protein
MKSQCTLIEPTTRINNVLCKKTKKLISRNSAAKYLRSCRQGKAQLVVISIGHYSILPLGLAHGFKLLTKKQ